MSVWRRPSLRKSAFWKTILSQKPRRWWTRLKTWTRKWKRSKKRKAVTTMKRVIRIWTLSWGTPLMWMQWTVTRSYSTKTMTGTQRLQMRRILPNRVVQLRLRAHNLKVLMRTIVMHLRLSPRKVDNLTITRPCWMGQWHLVPTYQLPVEPWHLLFVIRNFLVKRVQSSQRKSWMNLHSHALHSDQ